ncbi:PREDICTED: transcription factor PIF1-like [Tarenaya hassleriana]|uniref:transcription factor PIF1-like n=1 Tax=Tarenaya hassleriana TaxID=28532 RepID=UPI00053C75D1|nr:PREDICTED: transcription factor PIF1-like [Tarenaya hassleriana]XP_010542163.1 PREDICTED: transcription factor PIF1-like [Tarenaya hassleriana]
MNMNTNTCQSSKGVVNFANWSEVLASIVSPGFGSNPLQEVVDASTAEFSGPLNPPYPININLSPQPLIEGTEPRKEKAKWKDVGLGTKKTLGKKTATAARSHASSEKKRRDKINEKYHNLEQITPHSGKLDKATTIELATEHIRELQRQKAEYLEMYPHLKPIMCMSPRLFNAMIPFMMPPMPHMMPYNGQGQGFGSVPPSMSQNGKPFYADQDHEGETSDHNQED